MVDAFDALAASNPAGFSSRSGGVLLAFTASPIDFFNEVVPVDEPPSHEALEQAVATARQTGHPWVMHVRAGFDDSVAEAAAALGLVEEADYFYPAMACDALPPAEPAPSGLEVITVSTDAQYEEHLAVNGQPELTRSWLSRGFADDATTTLFTGYVDGTAVAHSLAHVSGTVVGVFNVGVRPEFRRRGYGWAMTLAAIRAGADAGATVAALQSSRAGYPVYAAHGFRRLFDYRCFREPAPDSLS